jgi:hypothetical protein
LGRPSFDIPKIQKFTVVDRTGRIDKIGHKKNRFQKIGISLSCCCTEGQIILFFPLCMCLEICIASYQLDRMVIWQSSVFSKRNGFMAFKQ